MMSQSQVRRRWRLAIVGATGLAVTGLGATASMAGEPRADRATHSMAVPVDRQFYVTSQTTTNPTDGSTVDAYDNDPSSIHVAVNGGSEFARSFVHLALDYLPEHSAATQITMTLHQTNQSDASNTGVYPIYNINPTQAIVEACALTTELSSNFDYTKPPAYDCQHGSAIGKPNKDATVWTFQLKGLIDYWRKHGNTGAALIPVSDGSSTWAIAFYRSRAAARVAYTTTAVAARSKHTVAKVTTQPPVTIGAGHPGSSGVAPASAPPVAGGGGAPPAVGAVTPSTATTSAPLVATQPAAAPGGETQHNGGVPAWPFVLVGSLLVAAAAIGAAHSGGLLALVNRISGPGIAAWRAHPRAYSIAAVASAWGLVFTSYSLVVTTNHGAAQPVAGNGTSITQQQPGTTTPGQVAPGQSQALTPGGVAPGGAVAQSGGTTNGAGVVSPVVHTNPAATEFAGPGTYRVINGIKVFFPAHGGPPVADLYHGADDTIGLSPSQIELCAHAALTYGQEFNISASDLNVYWAWLNDHGGIFGRKVHMDYENDNYDPGTAVQAAQACKDLNTFVLLGGIGFDQIPAVRQWAEQNHELYIHHVATTENTQGLRFSFSALPSVEQAGTAMGQLAVQRFRGLKVGIIYRNSSNWSPGVKTFEKVVKAAGMQVVGEYPVTINQGNYTSEISQLQAQGAQLVLAWENALGTIEIVQQAQDQNYHPAWLVFPFNIETNTLGSSSLDQPLWGVAAGWDGYDPGYYGGGFASYASEIHQFEAMYKQYDPNAKLDGDGGDLLFGAWEAWKWTADLLKACGQECTRNKIAGLLLAGYHHSTPPNCNADFNRTGDHHHGGYLFTSMKVIKDPNGRINWVPMQRCVTGFGG